MTRMCGAWLPLMVVAGCAQHAFVEPAPTPAGGYVFRNVQVFDARTGAVGVQPQDVHVRDGVIQRVAANLGPVDGAQDLNGGGVLLPGLVDVHTHTGGGSSLPNHLAVPHVEENLTALLYAGVTTVLDVGSFTPNVFELRAALASGQTLGPTLLAAGPIFTAPGSHPSALVEMLAPWPLKGFIKDHLVRAVTSPQDARRQVQALLPLNPDVIKVVVDELPLGAPRLGAEELAAICDEAHAHALPVVAHIGSSADALRALQAGVDALVHGVQRDAVTPEVLDALVGRRVPVAATMSVWHAVRRMEFADPVFTPLELEILRPATLAQLRGRPTGLEGQPIAQWAVKIRDAYAIQQANVRAMQARGVTLLAGSDSANVGHVPGAGLHLELDELVAAGLTPAQVLVAATLSNARFLTRNDEPGFGLVEEGRRADLLQVGADPTADIQAVHDIRTVMKGGVLMMRHRR